MVDSQANFAEYDRSRDWRMGSTTILLLKLLLSNKKVFEKIFYIANCIFIKKFQHDFFWSDFLDRSIGGSFCIFLWSFGRVKL